MKTGMITSNVRSPEAAMNDQGCKAKLPPGHVLACVTENEEEEETESLHAQAGL